jgi:uncharacterized membrane protein
MPFDNFLLPNTNRRLAANDSHLAIIMLKTITFTIMHFCIAFTVAYLLTGSFAVSGLVAIVEPLCNSVGFYFHDKVWKRIERRQGATPVTDCPIPRQFCCRHSF